MVMRGLEDALGYLDDAANALSGALDVLDYGGVETEATTEVATIQARILELAGVLEGLLYDI